MALCLAENLERAKRVVAELGDKVAFCAIDTSTRSIVAEWGIADVVIVDGKNIKKGPPLCHVLAGQPPIGLPRAYGEQLLFELWSDGAKTLLVTGHLSASVFGKNANGAMLDQAANHLSDTFLLDAPGNRPRPPQTRS